MIARTLKAGVLELRLDRAEKKNALTPAMLDELHAAIEGAAGSSFVDAPGGADAGASGGVTGEPVRAILLRGAGDAFCAGFDMALCRDEPAVLATLLTGLSRVVLAMRSASCPVVVAAHGAAVAGGCAIVAAADIAITHAGARLGYPVVKLGISPAVNGPTLSAKVGPGPARVLSLDARLIDGTEAHRLGLAHDCSADAGVCLERARQIARELADKPPQALAATKQLLNQLDGVDAGSLKKALAASLKLVGSREQVERVAGLWASSRH